MRRSEDMMIAQVNGLKPSKVEGLGKRRHKGDPERKSLASSSNCLCMSCMKRVKPINFQPTRAREKRVSIFKDRRVRESLESRVDVMEDALVEASVCT